MRAYAVILLLVLPLAAGSHLQDAGAPRIHNDPGDLVYGARLSILTDAKSGILSLHRPSPFAGSCHQLVSQQANQDGSIPILLDAAGTWILEHEANGLTKRTPFTVLPQELRILVAAQSTPTGYEYHVSVAHGAEEVPYAYVDVLHEGEVLRHLRSNEHGKLRIHEAILPYAGTYTLQAYRDLGEPRHEYSTTHRDLHEPPCNGSYHPPEQLGSGPEPGTDAVARHAGSLHVEYRQGASQVRGIQGTSILDVSSPGGEPLTAAVTLLRDGAPMDGVEAGLESTVSRGQVAVAGSWMTSGDVVLDLVVDVNQDGLPEYQGIATIRVRQEIPVRVVPVDADGQESGTLQYHVPAPGPDGRPGRHVLRFGLLDVEGQVIEPPQLTVDDIQVVGEVLDTADVHFDAAGYWEVKATPLGSDSDYALLIHLGDDTVVVAVETPPEGGAKAVLEDSGGLEVHDAGDVRVKVMRFNPDAMRFAECQPVPECAYEVVTDAYVYLAWADTGEPVTGPSGLAYAYRPGSPPSSCDCYQYQGTYTFLDVRPERSGTMVAAVKINVEAETNIPHYAYAPVPVAPERVLSPQFLPAHATAGQLTRFQVQAAGLNQETLPDMNVRILDAGGRDVTGLGVLAASESGVYWTASLPAGMYELIVEDRLDPQALPPLLGLRGTRSPGTLQVMPADVRFTYTQVPEDATLELQGQREVPVLGASLGQIVQLEVEVYDPLGQPLLGTVHLRGVNGDPGSAIALMAYSDENEPTRFAAPRLFAPMDPELLWMCDDPLDPGVDHEGCQSYYFQQAPTPVYAPGLDVAYDGKPVLVYVYGAGLGDVDVDFTPSGSTQNTRQTTASTIHVIPPTIAVEGVSTQRGASLDDSLAVGVENLVRLKAWDPTGVADLEGLELGLGASHFGPSQRPTGVIRNGSVLLALVPDATGTLGVFVVDAPAAADTGVRLNVTPAQQVRYVDGVDGIYAEVPGHVESGMRFTVRVATSREPFPQGVLEAFGAEAVLVSGTASLEAPPVERESLLPVVIRIPGYEALTRTVQVMPNVQQLGILVLDGVPGSVDEASTLKLKVSSSGKPVAGATATLLGLEASSDASGRIEIRVPRVEASTEAVLVVTHPDYATLQVPIAIHDVAVPRLELDVPRHVQAGDVVEVRVQAVDEAGQAIPVPSGVQLTIETTRAYDLHAEDLAATWQYTAPRLVRDVSVYAFVHAPGYTSDALLVTIKAVKP